MNAANSIVNDHEGKHPTPPTPPPTHPSCSLANELEMQDIKHCKLLLSELSRAVQKPVTSNLSDCFLQAFPLGANRPRAFKPELGGLATYPSNCLYFPSCLATLSAVSKAQVFFKGGAGGKLEETPVANNQDDLEAPPILQRFLDDGILEVNPLAKGAPRALRQAVPWIWRRGGGSGMGAEKRFGLVVM